MITSRRVLAALAVSALGACSLGAIRSHHYQRAREQVLTVLTARFETVFAADTGLAEATETPHDVPKNVAKALSAPFAVVQYGITGLGQPFASRIWHDTSWVFIGAADFEPPAGATGLGEVRSRQTAIFVLKHPGALWSFSNRPSPALKRTPDGEAWTWQSPGSEGHPAPFVFVATEVPGPYLVISDNERDCQSVANELERPPSPATDAGAMDTTAFSKSRLFGYRKYVHTENNRDASGMSVVSDDAIALQFSFEGKSPRGELALFGRNSQTADRINGARLLPALRMSSPGRWSTTIRLDRDSDALEELFAVLSLFGFGVYA
jgi:hypothetical protein